MYLSQLSLVNFRNYAEFESAFSQKVNCFVGDNGVGKTNLLDAIHYLSFCKSFFNPVDSQNIRHDEGFFVIKGRFDRHGEEHEVYCGIKRNHKKVFKRNKKEYERLSEHIGQFPLVMISPGDTELVNGGSEARRKFIDSVISQYDKMYLDKLVEYAQALRQRNALLKSFADNRTFDSESLEIWDDQLALHGAALLEKRGKFLSEFIPLFNAHYRFISNSREEVGLRYCDSLKGVPIKTAFITHVAKDRAMQHTTVGPHKDDLEFILDGYSLKKFASQGQQKSYLLALRLAQFEFIRARRNTMPLLLLDDVYDKLDESRFSRLLELVSGDKFGQVFITDTHPERMNQLLNEKQIEHKIFLIGAAVSREIS